MKKRWFNHWFGHNEHVSHFVRVVWEGNICLYFLKGGRRSNFIYFSMLYHTFPVSASYCNLIYSMLHPFLYRWNTFKDSSILKWLISNFSPVFSSEPHYQHMIVTATWLYWHIGVKRQWQSHQERTWAIYICCRTTLTIQRNTPPALHVDAIYWTVGLQFPNSECHAWLCFRELPPMPPLFPCFQNPDVEVNL